MRLTEGVIECTSDTILRSLVLRRFRRSSRLDLGWLSLNTDRSCVHGGTGMFFAAWYLTHSGKLGDRRFVECPHTQRRYLCYLNFVVPRVCFIWWKFSSVLIFSLLFLLYTSNRQQTTFGESQRYTMSRRITLGWVLISSKLQHSVVFYNTVPCDRTF